LVAAAEAEAIGFDGVTAVAQASGLSRGTVIRGLAEIKTAPKPARGQRIRRKGAGRKRTVDQDATLKRDLEALVEPVTRGDQAIGYRTPARGHHTSHRMVAELLHAMDYSLQANRKTLEGSSHPDRRGVLDGSSHPQGVVH